MKAEALGCDLTCAVGVVDPNRALTGSNRRDERASVRREIYTVFFCRAERDLLWCAIRKALSPDVRAATGISREVHPLSVRRPRGIRALRGCRTHRLPQ